VVFDEKTKDNNESSSSSLTVGLNDEKDKITEKEFTI
jgi:hypothetical protein